MAHKGRNNVIKARSGKAFSLTGKPKPVIENKPLPENEEVIKVASESVSLANNLDAIKNVSSEIKQDMDSLKESEEKQALLEKIELIDKKIQDIEELKVKVNELLEKAEEENKKSVELRISATREAESQKEEKYAQYRQEIVTEMESLINERKKEADSILADAKQEREDLAAELKSKIEDQNKIIQDLTDQKSKLAAKEITLKREAEERVQADLDVLREEHDKSAQSAIDWKIKFERKVAEADQSQESLKMYVDMIGSLSDAKALEKRHVLEMDLQKKEYDSLKSLMDEISGENQKLKEKFRNWGDDPSKLIKEIENFKEENEALRNVLADQPTPNELEMLRDTKVKYDKVCNDKKNLERKNSELECQLMDFHVEHDELEAQRRFVKILELQKSELTRELNDSIDKYNDRSTKVFANLSEIDKIEPVHVKEGKITSLESLCSDFQKYAEHRENDQLYYDLDTIRTFVAGFASSRLTILEGLSGTGKSSLPRAFADFIGGRACFIPVQSSWKDRNDLLGFYNDFKKQYKETEFLKALYEGTVNNNQIYMIVLDEMNLSRIEYYFADFLSVLEKTDKEQWDIDLVSDYAAIGLDKDIWPKRIDKGKIRITDNIWFIGTANKDDSTFTITDKVYDRSVIINFKDKCLPSEVSSCPERPIGNETFAALLNSVTWTDGDKKKFLFILDDLDKFVKTEFEITFGNRVINQMKKFVPAFISCGGELVDAIDIMFSSKVLRKIEGMYDEGTKESLSKLEEHIKASGYNLKRSIKLIEKMKKRIL